MDYESILSQSFCRTCLTTKDLSIMNSDQILAVKACTSIKLDETHIHNICLHCKRFLHELNEFKLRCFKANSIIESLAHNVKLEDCDVKMGLDELKTIRITSENVCLQCNKSFLSAKLFKRHLKIHLDETDSNVASRTESLGVDDDKLKLAECPRCQRTFVSSKHLKTHMRDTHVQPSKTRMKCKECYVMFSGHRALLRHWLKIHKNLAPPYQCATCAKPFCQKIVLDNHMRSYHAESTRLACPVCKKIFEHKRYVVRHMKTVHGAWSPVKCEQCHKTLRNETVRKVHMRVHKTHTHTSLCAFCGLKFAAIKAHIKTCRVRPDPPQLHCRFCKNTFKDMSELRQHHRHAHRDDLLKQELRFECEFCGKKFVNNSNLKSHINYIHQSEKPFSCSLCAKSFKQSGHLKRHLRCHMDERPFSCEFCDKRFRERSKVTRHMRVHTGENPYVCGVCHVAFKRNEKLKLHMNEHGVGGVGDVEDKLIVT